MKKNCKIFTFVLFCLVMFVPDISFAQGIPSGPSFGPRIYFSGKRSRRHKKAEVIQYKNISIPVKLSSRVNAAFSASGFSIKKSKKSKSIWRGTGSFSLRPNI